MKWDNMLMQPFSPGRSVDRETGKSSILSDDKWDKAFPNGRFKSDGDDVEYKDNYYNRVLRELEKQRG